MTDDLLGAAGARAEARGLYCMLGHDGNTVEELRELIADPPRTERTLRAFARMHVEDADWIEATLKFRQAVARECERLLREGVPAVNFRKLKNRSWALLKKPTPTCRRSARRAETTRQGGKRAARPDLVATVFEYASHDR
jgi:hypothetical protein